MKHKNILLTLSAVSAAFVLFAASPAGAADPEPQSDPEGDSGALKTQVLTGGSYNPQTGNATRIVPDLKVPGAVGDYGLDFTRYWNAFRVNSHDPLAVVPTDFGAGNWSHSWEWHVAYEEYDDETQDGQQVVTYTTALAITFPDGHLNTYKITRCRGLAICGGLGDDPYGPPYSDTETKFLLPGGGVYDLLEDMEPTNGDDFWLYLADGGAVHFVNNFDGTQNVAWPFYYQATEVFDPHGIRTTLHYDADGHLTQVKQDEGRWLTMIWNSVYGLGDVITRVETGGSAGGGIQGVDYNYSIFSTIFLTLTSVTYADDPAPGTSVSAQYTYSNCFGASPCDSGPKSAYALLKTADDPRFEGAMTRIAYTYSGIGYKQGDQPLHPYPDYAPLYYYFAPAETIEVESNLGTGQPVSTLTISPWTGTRTEHNGLGGYRMFYYGLSATRGDYGALGYQLVRLTDFTTGSLTGVPFESQNYDVMPVQLWDGRSVMTQLSYAAGDLSGEPSTVTHLGINGAGGDNSTHTYNRTAPGASEARDASSIPNPYNHWLFSETDEIGKTTTYVRDSHRRVKEIDYDAGAYETFTYEDTTNRILSHRLTSGAVETFTYVRGLLMSESDSVDPSDAKTYTYDSLDRVRTMTDGRARATGAPFTVQLSYNGRNKVIQEEYPSGAQGSPTPTPSPTATPTGTPTPTPKPKAATPTFTPVAGSYPAADYPKTVTIKTTSTGAQISYTTDNSVPSSSHGTIISSGQTASIGGGVTLKAMAFGTSYTDSTVASGLYSAQAVLTPLLSPDMPGGDNVYPQTSVTVTFTCTTPGASIHYATNRAPTSSDPFVASGGTHLFIGLSNAITTVQAMATKSGCPNSGIGSADYYSDFEAPTPTPPSCVAPNYNPLGGAYPASSYPKTITLTTTTSGAKMRYTTNNTVPTATYGTLINGISGTASVTGGQTLKAITYKTGLANSPVVSSKFTVQGVVDTPTLTPSSYTGCNTPVNVTFATTTTGASLSFTTNGDTPTPTHGTIIASNTHTSAFGPPVEPAALTVKVMAFKTGLTNSPVITGTYQLFVPRDCGGGNGAQAPPPEVGTPSAPSTEGGK